MGKRKNQQKKNKTGNVSLGSISVEKNQQKSKNTAIPTNKSIHSSLKDNVEVLNSTVMQPLDHVSLLKKSCKNANVKNVKMPENIESKVFNGNKFPKNKNRTYQDTVEEELIDFFGSPHNSDNKFDKTITQNSKQVKKNAASNQTNGVKHKSKSYVSHSTIQDVEGKALDMSLKENSNVNNGKCILNESTSNAISGFQSGYKFTNKKGNLKAQHSKEIKVTSKIRDSKSDSLYIKDYENSTYKFQNGTVDTTQKENSLSIEKYIPDKNSDYTLSIYQPHYEYSNEGKSLKSQNSKKFAMAEDNYSNISSYSKGVKHPETLANESRKMKQNIYSCVNAFKESNCNFDEKYRSWLFRRMQTLEKLQSLVGDLHDDQLSYNKAQKTCREIGCVSRVAKPVPSTLGFIASVSAFLSDTASGITSAVQAVNVDMYSNKFEEIMKPDAEATKDLYNARSQCIVEYQGIEEVMRMYHLPTFNSTVSKISNDLEIKRFWMDISNAYENDDASKMLRVVGNFLESGSQFEVLQKIGDSIVTYVDENPAALEVCNSACRAARGAFDLLFLDTRKDTALSCMAHASNQLMILDDREEINRLSFLIDDDSSQSKLEDKIHDAIYSLKFEMKQITDAFLQQLPIFDSPDDGDFFPSFDY